jgi:transcriptional regulator GlxA family with amidase domain
MEIVILAYQNMTALDAMGPYEFLSRLPDARLRFVAADKGPITADTAMLTFLAEESIQNIESADVLVIPGGPVSAVGAVMEDSTTIAWVAKIHAETRYTISICTGSLILGKAGVLEGKRAGCHWMALEGLREFGAVPCSDRIVVDGKLWTAGGVTSGIDMALAFAAEIAGEDFAQVLQLATQYDPKPPFKGGTPENAPAHIVELLRSNPTAVLG